MTTKQIDKRKGEREMQRFHKWMSIRVKSVHMADNSRMSQAYQKVYINSQ
jgi:hypothetical protein